MPIAEVDGNPTKIAAAVTGAKINSEMSRSINHLIRGIMVIKSVVASVMYGIIKIYWKYKINNYS